MYSCLLVRAAIKGAEHYDFFTYNGRTIELPYRGIEIPLAKGQRFGVRKSGDGKKIRLIFENQVNRVLTLDLKVAQEIARNIKREQ